MKPEAAGCRRKVGTAMAEKKITEDEMQDMVRKAQELKALGDEDKLRKLEEAAMAFSDIDIDAFVRELGKIAGDDAKS